MTPVSYNTYVMAPFVREDSDKDVNFWLFFFVLLKTQI